MQKFKVKLVERIKRTETVESFRFVSAEKIDFLPGQFLQLIGNLKIIYTVTDSLPKDESCFLTPINKDLLVWKTDDLKERILFIFGPPRMVEAMQNLGLELGCPKENIKTEQFLGY